MIVEKQMECRLAGDTEVLGENLLQRHFCPSQNPTWPDLGLNPGRRGGKPATNRLSYGAALSLRLPSGWAVFPCTSPSHQTYSTSLGRTLRAPLSYLRLKTYRREGIELLTEMISGVILLATCFRMVCCLAYYWTLKIETILSFETSVNFQWTTTKKIELFMT
jgi:hypothetical protein